jgi:hypothetical protein
MAKIASKGVLVKSGSAATPTTNLAQVRSVSLTIGEREMINTTTPDSTTSKDYISAPLRDTNQVEIEIAYDPANSTHEDVRAAHAAGTKWYFTVVLPDAGAAQWAMAGTITGFSIPALDAESGLLIANITYRADTVDTFTQ